jgi:hypothetical protein
MRRRWRYRKQLRGNEREREREKERGVFHGSQLDYLLLFFLLPPFSFSLNQSKTRYSAASKSGRGDRKHC